jgi:hypothetical protein
LDEPGAEVLEFTACHEVSEGTVSGGLLAHERDRANRAYPPTAALDLKARLGVQETWFEETGEACRVRPQNGRNHVAGRRDELNGGGREG